MDLSLVVVGGEPGAFPELEDLGVRTEVLSAAGYGQAFWKTLISAKGTYVISTPRAGVGKGVLGSLWEKRAEAEVIVASRLYRSGLLNRWFRQRLDLPIFDYTSPVRLYKRSALDHIRPTADDHSILPEILVRLEVEGYKIKEIRADVDLRGGGWRDWAALGWLVRLRNAPTAADADERAWGSRFPLRNRWLRKRQEIIVRYLEVDVPVLDVGCGSSRLIQMLAKGVGLDSEIKKLRYLRGRAPAAVAGDVVSLPFRDESFPQIVCSDVIGHVPEGESYVAELKRVLTRGGTLVVGAPHSRSLRFRLFGPRGERPLRHYTGEVLRDELQENGFRIDEARSVFGGETIVRAVID